MKTVAEVLAENPAADFFIDDNFVFGVDIREILSDYVNKPRVWTIGQPDVFHFDLKNQLENEFEDFMGFCDDAHDCPFSKDEVEPIQKMIDELIEKHKRYCSIIWKGEEVDIVDLWDEVKELKIYEVNNEHN